ncbi:hypothetical protein ACLMJK_002612 [Lecanora helva]
MSEDQDLLNRIGKLAGRINRHRTHTPSFSHDQTNAFTPPQSRNTTAQWSSPSSAAYGRGRGRIGKIAPNSHRNRTLVLNKKTEISATSNVGITPDGKQTPTNTSDSEMIEVSESPQVANGWVAKRDRHMQLINSSIYDKEAQTRNKAIEETRKQKIMRRDNREKQKIETHFKTIATHPSRGTPTAASHEITINGLRFQVLDGGSKLARIRGPDDAAAATPKKTSIGGVTFLRSKNGNLYRSGTVKARRAGQIRKHTANVTDTATGTTEDDDSDLVSDDDYDEIDTEDVDSDGLEEDALLIGDDTASQASHALSQQQDFVSF